MTQPYLSAASALAATLASALAAGPTPSPGVVAPGAEPCVIDGDAVTAADAERARSACEFARQRFAGLIGDPVPGVLILVQDRGGYRIGILDGRAVVLWPSSEAMGVLVGTGSAAEAHVHHQWRETLPHEIAHALTAAHFFPDGEFEPTGYGTPLPDWFEEGLAIWAEPRPSRESRLAAARQLPAHRLDLGTILTMRHPAAGNEATLAVRDGAAPPADRDLWDFYQQSIAVLAFVHDLGGPDAVRTMAARFMAGHTARDAVAGLPGLPDTFDAVAAAWRAWLAP